AFFGAISFHEAKGSCARVIEAKQIAAATLATAKCLFIKRSQLAPRVIRIASIFRVLELLHHVVDAKAGRFLPRRELLETGDPLGDESLRRYEQKGAVRQPIGVIDRLVLGLLEWVGAQVEDQRDA